MSKHKRMRLPNGFGQISEIKSAHLRKPFRAMVTVGKTELGRPIVKPLKPESYFKTYNEAYSALMKYHESPYDLEQDVTVKEIYERWYERKYNAVSSTMSYQNKTQMARAWRYCKSIENLSMRELRVKHIKHCMENGIAEIRGVEKTPDAATKMLIKMLFTQLFGYAIEYDVVQTNYAKDMLMPREVVKEAKEVEHEHIPYTDEEMQVFWDHVDENIIADIVVVQCYSGWRPQELLDLTLDETNITDWSFTGGMKTEAGKDRTVPIHSKIKEIVRRMYEESEAAGVKYLVHRVNKSGTIYPINYRWFLRKYYEFLDQYKISSNHRPHDGRTHFITQAKKYNVDEYAIKRIVGHAISDITERVYTKRDLEWYASEIEKIK